MDLSCYTEAGLLTIMQKIWRRTREDFGGSFDRPTFHACYPQRCRVFFAIRGELVRRESIGENGPVGARLLGVPHTP